MGAVSTPTLITVAPTGAETAKADAPALPVSLDELVATAKACEAAGAGLIHIHIRDDEAQPTLDLARLTDTVAAVREGTDLVVQLSTGGAVTDPYDARIRVLDALPDSCSLTCGTVNFGSDVFLNPWDFIVELYRRTQELEIVPEFELFDLGHVAALNRLLDKEGAALRRPRPRRPRARGPRRRPRHHRVRRHDGPDAARGRLLVGHRRGPLDDPGRARRAVRRRSPAGRHGGHPHVRAGPSGAGQRRAGRAGR